MNHELAKTLTTALVQFIDRERPEGTMDCSSGECERLEKAFEVNNLDFVEGFIGKKLSRLTEFEYKLVSFALQCGGQWDTANEEAKKWSNEFLSLAKKELLSYANESNPAIEAMADLERAFECNPDKLPQWLKNKLAKKHLEGYTLGKEDAMRDMRDFLKSYFNSEKEKGYNPPAIHVSTWTPPCDNGGPFTNPHHDCINCPNQYSSGGTITAPNTASGASTATLHGNTSATDGKEHNPSFTD